MYLTIFIAYSDDASFSAESCQKLILWTYCLELILKIRRITHNTDPIPGVWVSILSYNIAAELDDTIACVLIEHGKEWWIVWGPTLDTSLSNTMETSLICGTFSVKP